MSKTFVPHDYQHDIIEFIQDTPRCAVWAGMGTGKTVSTLTAVDALSTVEDAFPMLVLAPLRVAKSTWPDEIEEWAHLKGLRVSVICGTASERKAALAATADVYTINYDNLEWLVKACGRNGWRFKTIIADEFTRLKGYRLRQGATRARALSAVAYKSERFVGLTGTPSPNGLIDLWGQTWFLDRGARLGHSYTAFEDRWFKKGYNGYGVEPLPHAEKEIFALLRDICLTVAGLPVDEPIKNIISVTMPPDARSAYDEMEADMYTELGDETAVEVFSAASRSMKLLQFASGAVYVDDKQNWTETHRAKIEALESVIEEANGAPVLVAYHFKSDLARLQKAFPKARVLDANPKTIKDWNAGKIPVLFAHPASAGHGLNLARGGNILVFFTCNWNLEEHMQIIERIGPMRQKQAGLNRPVFIHYLVAKRTVDELVLDRLHNKRRVQDVILEAMKRRKK